MLQSRIGVGGNFQKSKTTLDQMQELPVGQSRDALSALRIDRTEQRRPRSVGVWLRRIFMLLMLLLVVGGSFLGAVQLGWLAPVSPTASGWFAVPDIMRNRPEVRVARPTTESGRSADATVVATGYLESRRQARIGARAPGRIQEVKVEEGSRVKKDEILAVLEHADLDASLAATEASVSRAKAAIEEQNVLIAQHKREFERSKKLLASKSISDTEYDQSRFQFDGAIARMESLKAEVQLAEARLQEAVQLKENMFIRAPFDGTVISKDAEVGESILPGGMGLFGGLFPAVPAIRLKIVDSLRKA